MPMRQELVNQTDPVGLQLKVARIRAGLKQYELAARVGVSGTVLSRIETGLTEPGGELLARLWAELDSQAAVA